MLTVQATDYEAEESLMRMNAVLGVIPLLPLQVLNSFIGMNVNISLFQFLKCMVAYIPNTLLYVFIGAGLKDTTDAVSNQGLYTSNPAAFSFVAGTLLMSVLIVVYTTYRVYEHFLLVLFMLVTDQDDDKSSIKFGNEKI